MTSQKILLLSEVANRAALCTMIVFLNIALCINKDLFQISRKRPVCIGVQPHLQVSKVVKITSKQADRQTVKS